jgi:hypothetical protein
MGGNGCQNKSKILSKEVSIKGEANWCGFDGIINKIGHLVMMM